MMNQVELKTLVPTLVASGVLVYEAITGNKVSDSASLELTNGILIGAGYMITLWGIWKNHQKQVEKKKEEVTLLNPSLEKPIQQEIPPNQPIVTQADYNNRGVNQ